jgi:hypothetical protein
MAWRIASLIALIICLASLPIWPYARSAGGYVAAFFGFITVLFFLMSIFSTRGTSIWRHRGQG